MPGHDCGYSIGDSTIGTHTCDLLNDPAGKIEGEILLTPPTFLSSVDNVEPKIVRVLEKVSSTIDKNEERCEETDRKDQHELEWKQVALVIGNIITTSHQISNIKYSLNL